MMLGCGSLPLGGYSVTPQRPTLSSDTGTTAPGSFELESGVAVDFGDSFSLPSVLKYGAGERSELFLGLSPLDVLSLPGEDADGVGDAMVGGRHRLWEGADQTSFALQWTTKLPTADEARGLGSGELDFGLAAILTQVLDDRTVGTAYYELGLLGDPAASGVDEQHALAIAASRSLSGHFGVFGELSHVSGVDGVDPLVATVGVTRALAPNVGLDVGVALGLNDDAPDAIFLLGITLNFGGPGL